MIKKGPQLLIEIHCGRAKSPTYSTYSLKPGSPPPHTKLNVKNCDLLQEKGRTVGHTQCT